MVRLLMAGCLGLFTAFLGWFLWNENEAQNYYKAEVKMSVIGAKQGKVTEHFLKKEKAFFKSPEMIKELITELSLDDLWGMSREQSFERLKNGLQVNPGKLTHEIKLSYQDPNPEVAKQILRRILQKKSEFRVLSKKDAQEVLGVFQE